MYEAYFPCFVAPAVNL